MRSLAIVNFRLLYKVSLKGSSAKLTFTFWSFALPSANFRSTPARGGARIGIFIAEGDSSGGGSRGVNNGSGGLTNKSLLGGMCVQLPIVCESERLSC